ncbi:replicative DNA helicase [Methylomonas sp. HYX-M1]|uniref:replicative DNA helicase n=1 Tax=Methylomonas sp. HYX-M1 TaxID=3139307 RepID=UPI00345BEF44
MVNNNKQLSYENAVVSILLRNPTAITSVEINPSWFEAWRHVISAAKAIAAAGTEVDALSIHEHLNRPGLLQQLVDLQQNQTGAVQNLQKYLAGLREIHQSKKVRQILTSTLANLDAGQDLSAALSDLMQATVNEISQDSRTYNYTIKQAMGAFLDHLDNAYDTRESGGLGLKTGIRKVDAELGGMHPGDLVIVGARPAVGKTAFGLSVLLNLAKSGKKVGFISTEMPSNQIMARIVAAETGISGHKIRDANLKDTDWPLMTTATKKVAGLNFRINDNPNVTIADIALQAKAWMVDGGVDLIVIDYLTRVKPTRSTGSQVQDVAEVVTGCKNIARQLNIPVMVLAQLNRNVTNRKDPRPNMADLRDSGVIEQEADQILLLYRNDDDLSPAEIIIDKNRHGGCATLLVQYLPETMQWTNLPDQHP